MFSRGGLGTLLLLVGLAHCVHGTTFCTSGTLPLGPSDLCVYGADQGDTVQLTFQLGTDVGWGSFGIGTSMTGSDIWVVWLNADGSATVSDRKAADQSMPVATEPQDLIVVPSLTTGRNITFTRKKVTNDPADSPITPGPMNYIYAVGKTRPATADPAADFKQHGSVYGTAPALDLFTGTGVAQGVIGGGLTPARQAHGVLMYLAWAVFVPIGIYIAMFFKDVLGVWWFRLHWGVLFFGTIVFESAGFGVLYMDLSVHFKSFHAQLGLAIYIASLFQIVLGQAINMLWKPTRVGVPWWDKLHWWIGRTMTLSALVNIFLGLNLVNGTSIVMYVLAGVWMLFVVAVGVWLFRRYGRVHHVAPKSFAATKAPDLELYAGYGGKTIDGSTLKRTASRKASVTSGHSRKGSAASNKLYDETVNSIKNGTAGSFTGRTSRSTTRHGAAPWGPQIRTQGLPPPSPPVQGSPWGGAPWTSPGQSPSTPRPPPNAASPGGSLRSPGGPLSAGVGGSSGTLRDYGSISRKKSLRRDQY